MGEKPDTKNNALAGCGCLLLVLIPIFMVYRSLGGVSSTPEATALQPAHIDAARAALADLGYPGATIEQTDSGWIAIGIELAETPAEGAQQTAEKALLAARNAVYVLPEADADWDYRVTLYGLPPGPGLVSVIGSARFSGSEIQWRAGEP